MRRALGENNESKGPGDAEQIARASGRAKNGRLF